MLGGLSQDGFRAVDGVIRRPLAARIPRLRLARLLWSGKPVDWEGRWKIEHAILGPSPHRPGGPPIWIGGSLPASLERAGRYFDGWLPIAPDAAQPIPQILPQRLHTGSDAATPGFVKLFFIIVPLFARKPQRFVPQKIGLQSEPRP